MPRLERASVTLASTAKALLAALDGGGAWLDVTEAWYAVEQFAPREDVRQLSPRDSSRLIEQISQELPTQGPLE